MAKHEIVQRQQKEKTDDKHRYRQPEPQRASESPQMSLGETPFRPWTGEHLGLLRSARSSEHLASLVTQLQHTYGNRYVARLLKSKSMQAKLTVSDPHDIYEQEADRVAEKVVRTVNHQAQRQPEEEEEEVQAKIQRQPEEEEEIQAASAGSQPEAVPENLENRIKSVRGNGHPLSDDVREPMGQALGADFSSVRVHTDSESDAMNRQINARAFTSGQDIFFRENEYSPGSDKGQKLIAHELTHVVQQSGGPRRKSSALNRKVDIGQHRKKDTQSGTDSGKNWQPAKAGGGNWQSAKPGRPVIGNRKPTPPGPAGVIGHQRIRTRPGLAETPEEAEEIGTFSTSKDGPTVGVTKKGLTAKGLKPFGDKGPSLDLTPDTQKLSFEVPGTDWSFPPPKGEWNPAFSLKHPIIPPGGIGINVEVGARASLGLNKLSFEGEHTYSENPDSTLHHLALTAGTNFTASIGGYVQVGIWGGVPYVITAEAGARARIDAKLKLEGKLGGALDIWYDRPAKGDIPREISREGQVSLELTGLGDLIASLQLYLSGQILIYKGDFFTFTIASATIASLKGGAVLGRRWNGGKGEWFHEKTNKSGKWVDFNWLFNEILRAKKLSRAEAKLKGGQRDVQALEDLQTFYTAGSAGGAPMIQRFGGKARDLIEQRSNLLDQYEKTLLAEKTARDTLTKEGDKSKKTTKKALSQAQKQLKNLENKIGKINIDMDKAHRKFLNSVAPENVDQALNKAKTSLSTRMDKNSRLYASELAKLESDIKRRRKELEKKIEDNKVLFDNNSKRLSEATTNEARMEYKNRETQLKAGFLNLQNDIKELDNEMKRKKENLQKIVTLE